ncbi:NYN domain-containing protein [Sulfitobacter guttiformis]|uniref:NYN domain-containing protein n=1 Tax=Sulfitobacter guttiformis TaxID=74349 RepID=UPI001474B9C9|nr:hypothetical protein [Sulfitobacter guttiformis]
MAQIFVDGSNVLFWRGGQADRDVPLLVIQALLRRRFQPVVYFDHSIGRHLSKDDLAALSNVAQVVIAPRGTPADALLLAAAAQERIQIVSCDRFRDWRPDQPQLRMKWLVTGRIEKGGQVSFSKKLKPAPL